ncbi:hypothetical protein H1R20_g16209, partial [Candolleomyces eurysporus]
MREQLLRPPQPFPAQQSAHDHPAALRAHGGTISFFPGASGVQMGDIQYFEASNVIVNAGGGAADKSIDGWEIVLKNTAPNALYNSSARYDAPKCDEDTRVEVTSEIMAWLEDRGAPQRLLCMTGAAGSGKSALQQTVAEKCSKGALKQQIKSMEDPFILSQSLEAQMVALIVDPLRRLRDLGVNVCSLPYAILIDGLDECKEEDRQAELLTAIRRCLLADDLPFRIFIASRPEWAIRTALEPGGHLHEMAYHIQLSDKYDASADMRRYLRRRFEDIGLRIGDSKWFTEGDIETLVRAASGQFIYVATVYKYISERRASPAERLKIVLTWTPHKGQAARPFEALDTLYTNILLNAKKAYEAVDSHHGRDFLLLFRAHHINIRGFRMYGSGQQHSANSFSVHWLGLEARAEESLISDLRSLVVPEKDDNFVNFRLRLYHKSFSDFLEQESRAKDLFVPAARVEAYIAKCFMQRIIECRLNFNSLPNRWEKLSLPEDLRGSLKMAVNYLPSFLCNTAAFDNEFVVFTQNGGWSRIDKLLPLLYHHNDWPFTEIRGWIEDLYQFTDNVKVREPKVATVISKFVKKWDPEFKEWILARSRRN